MKIMLPCPRQPTRQELHPSTGFLMGNWYEEDKAKYSTIEYNRTQKKTDDFQCLLCEHNIHIACLQEIKLRIKKEGFSIKG